MSAKRTLLAPLRRWTRRGHKHHDVLGWALAVELGLSLEMYRTIKALAELAGVVMIGLAGLQGQLEMTLAAGAIVGILVGPELAESMFIDYVLEKHRADSDSDRVREVREALDDD